VPVVVGWISTYVSGILVSVGVGTGVAGAIGTFVGYLVVGAGLGALMGALQPKPKGRGDQGVQLDTALDPTYPREVGVGQFPTGGSLGFEDIEGVNNENLWRIYVLSDVEMTALEQVIGGGNVLTFGGDLSTGLRPCTSHHLSAANEPRLFMRFFKGTQDQAAPADLIAAFPSLLDENFRGRGIVYDPHAWQTGGDFVFVGQGAKCLDPRTSEVVFTKNPVLIGRQFLKGFSNNGVRVVGLGVSDADLPHADYVAGADECDELVAVVGGTEPRYEMGGMLSGRETPRDVLAHIAAAIGGAHVDRGGQIVLLPGVARAPVLTVEEADLLADAPLAYAARRTADERVNAIASRFVNPDDKWQEAALPPRKDAAALAADGERYETSRLWRFVNRVAHGQRLDQIELRRARKEGALGFSAPLWALELAPGDVFEMASPRWGGEVKQWEVETTALALAGGDSPSARVAISARETSAASYAFDPLTDQLALGGAPIIAPPPLPALVDEHDRIITVDGLPIGALGGTGIRRTPVIVLAGVSSSQINVTEHQAEFVGRLYELPAASITALSADTLYWVFWDVADEAYDAEADPVLANAFFLDASRYVPCGSQRTQTGGGGYSPPPPPPPGYYPPGYEVP